MLINNKDTWPPRVWADVYDQYELHSAWYSGDPNKLVAVYSGQVGPFWSAEKTDERKSWLHVPVAGDIAATSARFLFGTPPKMKTPVAGDEPTAQEDAAQKRLDYILRANGMRNKLLEGAQTCAAMGGVFLKLNIDRSIMQCPVISIVQADCALPEFTLGVLRRVTLWKELPKTQEHDTDVWRWLEVHEPGVMYTQLYRGTTTGLGSEMPLDARPETANQRPIWKHGLDGLAVRYIPNMRPNRRDRGSYLGQSDYAGSETLMDSLDEVYTSLQRDVNLGVGRIFLKEWMLQKKADGSYAFDMDKAAFVALDGPNVQDGKGIENVQFDIRSEQHIAIAENYYRQIVNNAGYSPQSFGMDIDGSAPSGTALKVREQKSYDTTAAKAEYWRAELEGILTDAMTIDAKEFNSGVSVAEVSVEMQDNIRESVGDLAPSLKTLRDCTLMSRPQGIRALHPDWTKKQVDEENKLLEDEEGVNVEDPTDPVQGGFV